MYFRPSWTSWWARQTNSILLIWLNCIEKRPSSKQNQLYIVINKRKKNTSWVTLVPKSQPAPRGLTAHVSISSGSLHIRSQKGPSYGISQLRSVICIWKQQRYGIFMRHKTESALSANRFDLIQQKSEITGSDICSVDAWVPLNKHFAICMGGFHIFFMTRISLAAN